MPEAAFNSGPPHHNNKAGAATHRQSAARNEVDEAVPPALAQEVATSPITRRNTPNISVPAAVPAVHVSNPHQQLHNGIARIIRPRPLKWTKRCQYDLSTGCHRGTKCFFGHLGDVYTDSPTVLQEFTSNGFNTMTLSRADLEEAGGSLDVGQALGTVLPSSQRYPRHNASTADQSQDAVDNSKKSGRDLLLAGAMDVNAHFTPRELMTPREHMWDEETLHAGAVHAPTVEYERMPHFELPASALPAVTYVQRTNSQERSQYPPAPGYSYHENDAATSYHNGLVYGLAVGMAPFFGASTSPLESPGNLFRLNTTTDLYYYGVDRVMYQYNAAFWAARSRQYHMDQHTNNFMNAGGSNSQQFSGPAADPRYQYLQSWINDLPTPNPAPEGYSYSHAQSAGAWPLAHQQHGYASPAPQQGYDSRITSSRQHQQEQPAHTGGFHQYTGLDQKGAPQSYEETFPRLTPKPTAGCKRQSGSK